MCFFGIKLQPIFCSTFLNTCGYFRTREKRLQFISSDLWINMQLCLLWLEASFKPWLLESGETPLCFAFFSFWRWAHWFVASNGVDSPKSPTESSYSGRLTFSYRECVALWDCRTATLNAGDVYSSLTIDYFHHVFIIEVSGWGNSLRTRCFLLEMRRWWSRTDCILFSFLKSAFVNKWILPVR